MTLNSKKQSTIITLYIIVCVSWFSRLKKLLLRRPLDVKDVDFAELDAVIRKHVPSGMAVRSSVSKLVSDKLKDKVYKVCQDINDVDGYMRHLKSIGSLGGGNHFLEINKDKDGYLHVCLKHSTPSTPNIS